MFNTPEHARFFLGYINEKHKIMNFSIKTEINGSLYFHDVKINFLLVFLEKKRLLGYTLVTHLIELLFEFIFWFFQNAINHHELDNFKNVFLKKWVPKNVY